MIKSKQVALKTHTVFPHIKDDGSEGAGGGRRITTCPPRFSDLAPSLHSSEETIQVFDREFASWS